MRAFAAAILLLTALAAAVPVHHLEPLSDQFDAIAVFLPGGQLPASPWLGISDDFRERFWTLGCHGFLVQRTAWCAYLAVTPAGTAGLFLDEMAGLGDSAVMSDTSIWAGILQLEPVNDAGAVAVVWHACDEPARPPTIPLRGSLWLAAGNDTLITNGPWSSSTFLWTRDIGEQAGYDGAWRGSGTEIVPVGPDRSVIVSVLCSTGMTPAELQFADDSGHEWDDEFGRTWTPVLQAVDALVAASCPPVAGPVSLLWLKGSGAGAPFEPWKTAAVPPPPARSRSTIAPPADISGFQCSCSMPSAPGISMTTIRCTGASVDETAVFAGVFERVLARSALPELPGAVSVAVEAEGDSIRVWLAADCVLDAAGLAGMLPRLLGPTALCPPESELVANAALRASIRTGRFVATPSPTTMIHILAEVLGLLD